MQMPKRSMPISTETDSTEERERLAVLRSEIDAVDEKIQALINQRARCAQDIGAIKRSLGTQGDYYRPDREAQVLRRIKDRNTGPLGKEEVARLFREIMSACLALEEPLDVAFLGPEGTFTQAAAIKHFGRSIRCAPLGAIHEVFREVESGNADYGVVPVENSTEGVVSHTLDLFLNSPLSICGEVALRIHHHLLAKAEDWSKIETVYSHQQSLAQCREWLDLHLPRARRVATSSHGEAARLVAGEKGAAAIAGDHAAEIYALKVLERNIEDDPSGVTRFLVIGRQEVGPSGHDKTSLLVSSRNRIGSLHRLIEPISRHGVEMTRIESRPSRFESWGYLFFIDIDGHVDEAAVASALSTLENESTLFRVLGSYPKAVL